MVKISHSSLQAENQNFKPNFLEKWFWKIWHMIPITKTLMYTIDATVLFLCYSKFLFCEMYGYGYVIC